MRYSVRKVRLNNGGYDSSGKYWGIGQPLYFIQPDDDTRSYYLRAVNREAVKQRIRKLDPSATFYR